MQRLLLISAISFLNLSAFSQSEQTLIDQQVWIPFMESFSGFDGETFLSLHADDMIRVTQDDDKLRTKAEYAEGVNKWWPKNKAEDKKRTLELRFIQRIATETDAFEVGIYKTSYPKPDGAEQNHFGKFHVILKKIDGTWKITVDADSNYEGTITEKDFEAAEAIER